MPLLRLMPRFRGVRSLRASLRREEGATLLEFAFSLGIFLAVTIGILVLCMALFSYEYVDFASREAVRWAAVRGADCANMPQCNAGTTDIENYVKGLNYPIVNPSGLKITATWMQFNPATSTTPTTWTACGSNTGCNSPGDAIQVTISYPFSFGIPFVGNFAPTVSSTSQMVISQ